MMKFNLENKVAIITGGAQGMGHSIATMLGAEGARVVIADLNVDQARQAVSAIESEGGQALAVRVDVSKSSDLDTLLAATLERFGQVDILVNNAGICPRTDFETITEEEWDRVLSINLKSVFLLTQKVFIHMKQRKYGRIVNMASAAGKLGGVQVGAHYSASKAGIICLTKTIALNGAKYGICANAVCPGVIGTQMTTSIDPEKIEHYKRLIPLGRIGSAEDVARAVVFLVSDLAGYITGEVMDVNGGFLMD
jgi:3-oxoacyl-[acyl-carrier protein] reductase